MKDQLVNILNNHSIPFRIEQGPSGEVVVATVTCKKRMTDTEIFYDHYHNIITGYWIKSDAPVGAAKYYEIQELLGFLNKSQRKFMWCLLHTGHYILNPAHWPMKGIAIPNLPDDIRKMAVKYLQYETFIRDLSSGAKDLSAVRDEIAKL